MKAEHRGMYDPSRKCDSLILIQEDIRAALFCTSESLEKNIVHVAVTMEDGASRCYSIQFADLVDYLRNKDSHDHPHHPGA